MRRTVLASMAVLASGPFAVVGMSSAHADLPVCTSIAQAIGAPGHDVGPQADAGRVWFFDSADDGLPYDAPSAQAGARFGATVAIADVNGDGCTDAVIGAPSYDISDSADVGAVFVVSEDGLGSFSVIDTWMPGSNDVPGPAQEDAHFGKALAVVVSGSSTQVAVGEPGLTVHGAADAGAVSIAESDGLTTTWTRITARTAPIFGQAHAGDRLGASLSTRPDCADPGQGPAFEAGMPGRMINGRAGAGAVLNFASPHFITQNTLVGHVEKGDHFGAALSGMYIGVPGEDIGSAKNAGYVDQDSCSSAPRGYSQNTTGVAGHVEAGDRFGAALDTAAGFAYVGAPGEDVGRHADAGEVDTVGFSCVHAGNCKGWTEDTPGVPGQAEKGDHFGASLANGADGSETVGDPGEDAGTGAVIFGLATQGAEQFKADGGETADAFGISIA